jgi:hypothetical protein
VELLAELVLEAGAEAGLGGEPESALAPDELPLLRKSVTYHPDPFN